MSVVICLPLFGAPDHELESGAVQGRQLRELASSLGERLQHAADTVDRLLADGWSAQLAMYDVILSRAGVETRVDAEKALRALGIAPEELLIVDEVNEEGT
jgi:hypothetical protein